MNVAETILVFVGGPLAVTVVLALLIFVPGGHKRARYKPGQPWEHAPVWYEPQPERPAGGHSRTAAIGSSLYGEPTDDGQEGHGSSAAASRPVSAGPLGGARGTW